MDKADKILGILQKTVVVIGAIAAAWYVFVRQDHSIHAILNVSGKIQEDCTLVAQMKVQNPKGVIIEPVSFSIQAYTLDYREIVDTPDNQLRISEQLIEVENIAKVGEDFSRVLAIRLPERVSREKAIMLRAQMTLKDSKIYNEETIVEVPKCVF
ncbi:hypothetical protein [uncultured Ruegeria sp.]|uniref:hypothetical protein n=1 Tax=uncultured Ruegeria sp. TaxID=259304 RepID=UPI00260446AA|nr:hypothetical protein [uncultured Ruegeria sp.]